MSKAVEIPKTCKAGVVVNPGPHFRVAVEDVPVPEPGPDEILIRLNATGLCYSDVHYMLEDLPMRRMGDSGVRSPGHEGAGVVVKLGENVKNWKIGDRAGVKPLWDTSITTGLQVPGTYQQYITSPAKYASPIPEGVEDITAGPIMCSGSTIYSSIVESELKPGDWAVFPGGGGGVGHMGVQLAKAMGMRVVVVDAGPAKRKLCEDILKVDAFVDFMETPKVEDEVVRITDGKGAHGVFVTATSAEAYKSAPMMVRVGGRVMCIGLPAPTGEDRLAGAMPGLFVRRNLHIIGTLVGSMLDTHKALEFAARGLLKPITEVYPLSQLPEAIENLKAGKVAGRCVIDFNA